MAKEVKSAVSLDDLLNLNISEIKAQTVSGGRSKRSNWDNLNDEQKALLHKKVLVNNKIAADFKMGLIDEAQFFVIGDVPTNEKTPVIKRGQKISFFKDNEVVEDIVVGFKQSGTGKKPKYLLDGVEITFPCSGMSITTANNGDRAINKCNLNPKSEE